MKHYFAVENEDEFRSFQAFVSGIIPRVDEYITFLKNEYQVRDLPQAIVWANRDIATKFIADIPVPAYTNERRIVMCPDLDTWRDIYLKQLDDPNKNPEICDYYMHRLNEHHVLQILGHELAHHSNYFPNSEYDSGIWFEEGMVEYISRQYFLTDAEFRAAAEVNRKIVDLFRSRYGNHPLEEFGSETYENDYASIFYEYWRSYLAVEQIISKHSGNVQTVFEVFRQWYDSDRTVSLEKWFNVQI